MNRSITILLIMMMTALMGKSQNGYFNNLPDSIYSGEQGKFHVQGVAVDQVNQVVYFSFTDKLVKMDLFGNLIGSVTRFTGHLGDLTFDPENGKVYASLEFKGDAIGKNIRKNLGLKNRNDVGFYVAIFDGSKIVRPDMDAGEDDILKTVYIKEAVDDYQASVEVGGRILSNRYGCSGIDGIALAPSIGKPNSDKKYLYLAYGIYGDTTRNDNDYQIILKYNVDNWDFMGRTLDQTNLHLIGPEKPLEKYFVKTGNTRYGIQNLAYDGYSGNFFAAVYRGDKSEFPNYSLFVIDGHKKPFNSNILSENKAKRVKMLSLVNAGLKDEYSGIRGWYFEWGSTGLCPLGEGMFYISHNRKTDDGMQETTLHKYKWIGEDKESFRLID